MSDPLRLSRIYDDDTDEALTPLTRAMLKASTLRLSRADVSLIVTRPAIYPRAWRDLSKEQGRKLANARWKNFPTQ
jgi:hypothetical protein